MLMSSIIQICCQLEALCDFRRFEFELVSAIICSVGALQISAWFFGMAWVLIVGCRHTVSASYAPMLLDIFWNTYDKDNRRRHYLAEHQNQCRCYFAGINIEVMATHFPRRTAYHRFSSTARMYAGLTCISMSNGEAFIFMGNIDQMSFSRAFVLLRRE